MPDGQEKQQHGGLGRLRSGAAGQGSGAAGVLVLLEKQNFTFSGHAIVVLPSSEDSFLQHKRLVLQGKSANSTEAAEEAGMLEARRGSSVGTGTSYSGTSSSPYLVQQQQNRTLRMTRLPNGRVVDLEQVDAPG